MSIEKLEKKVKEHDIEGHSPFFCVGVEDIFSEIISTLKDQSSAIADLRKELAKKEDIFDVNEVKEVRNLNEFICGTIKNGIEIGYRGHTKYMWVACPDCGKERWVALYKNNPVSIRCAACASKGANNNFYGKHHTEETKDKKRGKNNPNYGNYGKESFAWMGGRKKDNEGYISVWIEPTHQYSMMINSNGYVYEHRLIMAQYLGRALDEKEVVHHINEVRDDNRIENLQLFKNNAEHLAYHGKIRKENKNHICGSCYFYDFATCFCSRHPEYGEVCEKDTCDDYAEVLNV